MKPIHIIAGLGATAIIVLVAWILYLNAAPLSGQSIRRGLSPELLGTRTAAPTTPSTPKSAPTTPSSAP